MQMSVCHRHPVIMLYLCLMPFRRKPSRGRPVSCSLTVHWLHRPGRLLEARVMKADIVSCLGAKAHGFVLQLCQGVGLRGIPFPQNSASGFGPLLLHPASRACPSSRWPHFMALSGGPSFVLCGISPFSPSSYPKSRSAVHRASQRTASDIAARCVGCFSALRSPSHGRAGRRGVVWGEWVYRAGATSSCA